MALATHKAVRQIVIFKTFLLQRCCGSVQTATGYPCKFSGRIGKSANNACLFCPELWVLLENWSVVACFLAFIVVTAACSATESGNDLAKIRWLSGQMLLLRCRPKKALASYNRLRLK
jgi:hypothetical protein